MSKIISLLLLVLFQNYSFAQYGNSGRTNDAVSGWENVFAYNISSVIPLYHYGSKSYYMGSQVKAKYLQAMQFCENIHMKLVTIRTTEENDRIQKYIREANLANQDFWTSGSKLLDGRNWIWMSYGDGVQYTNWAPGKPNDARSQCIKLESRDGRLYWHDARCDDNHFFICERYSGSEVGTGVSTESTASGWMNMLSSVSSNIGLLHYKGKKYFFSKSLKTNYLQAVQFCKIIKMDLVTISSEDENNRIHKYIRDINGGTNWWTSGTRLLDSKSWVWLTRGSHVEYTNWLPGQPDGNDEYCLQLVYLKDRGLYWQDSRCSDAYNIICETPCSDNNENCRDDGWIRPTTRRTTTVTPRSILSTPPTTQSTLIEDAWKYQVQMTSPGDISYAHVQGRIYHRELDLMGSVSQATFFCQYHKMNLISIVDETEQKRVEKLLADSSVPGPFWTSSRKVDGIWTWSFPSEPLSYTNWAAGRPRYGDYENCMEVTRQGEWLDADCTEMRHFICEMPGFDYKIDPRNNFQSIYPGGHCSSEPVVNIYISNNVISEDGKNEVSQNFLSSKDTEVNSTGYYVHVSNTITAPESAKDTDIV